MDGTTTAASASADTAAVETELLPYCDSWITLNRGLVRRWLTEEGLDCFYQDGIKCHSILPRIGNEPLNRCAEQSLLVAEEVRSDRALPLRRLAL